ncbi:MAG: FAD:protein FMN transferase [Paludibacteraceae bacterium]
MKKNLIYGFGLVLMILFVQCAKENEEYTFNKGQVFGTYYSITYLQPKKTDLQQQIEEKFKEFDNSLSTFNPNSVISKINRNDPDVATDRYFEEMYNMARQVSEKSGGAFDITVAPLVNAWGFGFGNHDHSVQPKVDSILPFIGYKKIALKNHKLIKNDSRIMLDASAIAKGQSCDVIAKLLEENGCKNYMVEIGGEIVCKGVNPKGEKWHIGIDKPNDDPANEEAELQTIIALSNGGLATSGNYRQFYFRDGKKYAHTIEPRTGFPVNHSLLSASVIAPTCMQADAYATAFMVLGADSSMQICNSMPGMDCYLIYEGKKGELLTAYTKGFEKYFAENKP